MLIMNLIYALSISVLALSLVVESLSVSRNGNQLYVERDGAELQNIVTYDEHSLIIYGERVFIFSGEFHPFRLPVPDLWSDVFTKVKSLGFNCVSFYSDWALLEGQPDKYLEEGIFSFEPFFAAAKAAGIYLIARPGPYINAEVAGGGFPGWLQRIKGQLRSRDPDYQAATDNYMANIGATIEKAQITNGGPIILVQVENEYTRESTPGTTHGGFPDPVYFAAIKKQLRDAGIVVPLVSNDANALGIFAPGYNVNGSTAGDVDIYGHDYYPLRFDCANPYTWPSNYLPASLYTTHEKQSPTTPFSLLEYQGGSFDPWGGLGFDKCAVLLNMEFERVFYKNDFAGGITILNIYMIFGGTNWGNLGHSGGYTSYDYGSAIGENRQIEREKFSELKLEAQFMKVTPTYLTASIGKRASGVYTDTSDITTTPLFGNGSAVNFYVVRHTDYQTLVAANYKLNVETSRGNVSIPQLGGVLTLNGRDSKWHVTDYPLGDAAILEYSSAEIFTWKQFPGKTVLIVYGGPGERHELSVITTGLPNVLEDPYSDLVTVSNNGTTILNWSTSTANRRVVQIGDLFVYILDRNTAYNYWVPDFVGTDERGAYGSTNSTSLIVEAGYLIRSVSVESSGLHIYGDLNATVPIRLIGAPAHTNSLYFNSEKLEFDVNPITGEWASTLNYVSPSIFLPDLSSLEWKYLDNLPEIQTTYSDLAWTVADHSTSNNTVQALLTPTSLFAADYGYNTGVLNYRGKFVANGNESTFSLYTQGGSAFGHSVWLGPEYVGSWTGIDADWTNNKSFVLPKLVAGKTYIITVLLDQMGLDENGIGDDNMKSPRGILDYSLSGRDKSAIIWKLTGNLGGEAYIDKVRGPLNEGGLYAERQGFTQPYPPNRNWASRSPEDGIHKAGVAFYQTSFSLDLPRDYDIPLSFHFGNTTMDGTMADYRAQLWINGYQYGKYVNSIGPQTDFPVPQGILNYHGENWLAIELWAQQANGAQLINFTIEAGTPVMTSLKAPGLAPMPNYAERPGVY